MLNSKMAAAARLVIVLSACLCLAAGRVTAEDQWVKYGANPEIAGEGGHIVLISGDEEYRSEEALPQLAKILSQHHGFDCTVLFAIDPATGEINPNINNNIPGTEVLETADLLILFTRMRDLPDEQMAPIVEYVESGRPIIGLRTATHAFMLSEQSSYRHYDWQDGETDGGFGRVVLGEKWINHHGDHGSQSTLGIVNPDMADHPILTGIQDGDIWGPTDVYGVRLPLPGDSQPLVFGQVLEGMEPDSPPVDGPQNNPMMPVAWVKSYTGESGVAARIFTTTMGASQDLASEGLRRLIINAVYWGLEREDQITPDLNIDIVGEYQPTRFAFDGYTRGVRPEDHALPAE
jgi:hypothetical protein